MTPWKPAEQQALPDLTSPPVRPRRSGFGVIVMKLSVLTARQNCCSTSGSCLQPLLFLMTIHRRLCSHCRGVGDNARPERSTCMSSRHSHEGQRHEFPSLLTSSDTGLSARLRTAFCVGWHSVPIRDRRWNAVRPIRTLN